MLLFLMPCVVGNDHLQGSLYGTTAIRVSTPMRHEEVIFLCPTQWHTKHIKDRCYNESLY